VFHTRRNQEEKEDHHFFCLSAGKKCIIVEEGEEILVGDTGVTIADPFKHFVGLLPEKNCHYALHDASFETKES
jgi:destrin (actin-depolymerizing factor)